MQTNTTQAQPKKFLDQLGDKIGFNHKSPVAGQQKNVARPSNLPQNPRRARITIQNLHIIGAFISAGINGMLLADAAF